MHCNICNGDDALDAFVGTCSMQMRTVELCVRADGRNGTHEGSENQKGDGANWGETVWVIIGDEAYCCCLF